MGQPSPHQEAGEHQGQSFAATHWSVVLAAGHASAEQRRAALETLCSTYWVPLYTYVRRLGYEVHDAEDLTQGFFAHLLNRDAWAAVCPAKGKFRSFLLASLKHYLADSRDRSLAAKRGGGCVLSIMDCELVEDRYQSEYSPERSAECLFDRRWALTLLDRAFLELKEEYAAAGKAAQFEELGAFLSREGGAAEYASVAARLGQRPGTIAVAVHRLRLRYRELIRAEICQTVAQPGDVEEEMHYLLEVIAQ